MAKLVHIPIINQNQRHLGKNLPRKTVAPRNQKGKINPKGKEVI